MPRTERSFLSSHDDGQHRIVYDDWGDSEGRPLVCVHGLSCNARDLSVLAETLIQDGIRVIAMDLPGRGRSDYFKNPLHYHYNQYLHDISALLAHLDLAEPASVDWLGVSLGGLLGIKLAGMESSPIKRLIINDVGPEVHKPVLDFIALVIGQSYIFDTIEELELRMRATRGLSWGPLTHAQWRHMAENNARALDDGRITYAYDPAIVHNFNAEPTGEHDLWPFWDAIACPTLVLQGAQSLVLPEIVLEKMRSRGPAFDLHVFDDCGHVPSLMEAGQIEVVRRWLKMG